ncbi:hypothetical protein [Mucilaginibacter paludis]|uniref:Uncharacterized protein n=1 Tax=Mucilaginibacter paludis DSM 18603 TaxID=714943 RepID=H1Y936_9SPHI|nr:hypothetical protein [Mucilaginibacter paludis]EHQ29074.1 hypothetical protein Mucpa_4995 [Mucilaginibacter paludis DSM 18603]
MTTTQSTIVILIVLDMMIVLFAHRVDRRYYRKTLSRNAQVRHFFCNPEYDERFTRLLLSRGGLLLTVLFFITIFILNSKDSSM